MLAALHLHRREEPAHLDRNACQARVVLFGAEDLQHLRPLILVSTRARCGAGPAVAEDDRHDFDRRRAALDRVRVAGRHVRPLQHLLEVGAGREAHRRELGDEDGVRPNRPEHVAQRFVEAAQQRRHADDRRDADDDAEHGQRRPHLVGSDRVPRHREDFAEECPAHGLLPSQRFDRIERRRAHRRIQPEEQPDDRRHRDAERHRPRFHGGGQRAQPG